MTDQELAQVKQIKEWIKQGIFPSDSLVATLLAEVDRLRTELQQSQAREGASMETMRLVAKWMEDRPTLSSDLDRQIKFDIYDKIRQALAGEGGNTDA